MARKHHDDWRWALETKKGRLGGINVISRPPFSTISSHLTPFSLLTQPMPDGLVCMDQYMAGWGGSDWVHRVVVRERWEILCSLPLAPRKGEVGKESVGYGGGFIMPRATQTLLPSVTISTGTLCFSFPVFLSTHIDSCLLPSFFLFLLLSA